MNNKTLILDKSLIFKDLIFNEQKELFIYMNEKLKENGYVKEGYAEAIIRREKKYPTGFQIGNIAIAIPHVDSKYANKNGIFICTLKNTIKFEDAEKDEMIDVKIIFGSIIKDHNEHIEFLTKISELFQKKGFLEDLRNSKTADEMYNILVEELEK